MVVAVALLRLLRLLKLHNNAVYLGPLKSNAEVLLARYWL